MGTKLKYLLYEINFIMYFESFEFVILDVCLSFIQ